MDDLISQISTNSLLNQIFNLVAYSKEDIAQAADDISQLTSLRLLDDLTQTISVEDNQKLKQELSGLNQEEQVKKLSQLFGHKYTSTDISQKLTLHLNQSIQDYLTDLLDSVTPEIKLKITQFIQSSVTTNSS